MQLGEQTAPIQTGVQVCGDKTPQGPADVALEFLLHLMIKINSTGNGMQILPGIKKLTSGKNDGEGVDTHFQF